jgi:hypothetical protein
VIAALSAMPSSVADSRAASDNLSKSSKLVTLAAAQFPNLTKAERALLWFSDVKNIDRGEIALAGPNSNRRDPSNDPAYANKWDEQRNVRAALIRWLCVDPGCG